jgi:hypothetical protein
MIIKSRSLTLVNEELIGLPGVAADWCLFFIQKIVRRDTGLFENRTKSALWHVAGVIGNGGVLVSLCVVPDLVTTGSLAVKGKAKCFKTLGYLPVAKTCQSAHLRPHDEGAIEGIADDVKGRGAPPLFVGVQKFPGDIAGNFHGLGYRPPLGYQTGEIIGSGKIHAFRQFLDVDIYKPLHMVSPENLYRDANS